LPVRSSVPEMTIDGTFNTDWQFAIKNARIKHL
jgi:hypothetical protein